MKKSYKIRKMSFICQDGRVIEPNIHMTNAYQFREIAEAVCRERQPTGRYMWEVGRPIPKLTVEDFYLVHASLFKEILQPFCVEVMPPKR
ncbi:hypothetical protein LX66_1832 [Chitinophaga japonensis]|uniref:Uncharacterized protein n=1 Tax=Chitinophaga japonensis TaxID=104662 RepID=A0A562T252_CHIJA|nr:hypothetical protein LX66_1832 [Chitinophaga japonensis]